MVIHTKQKAKIHSHTPRNSSIKGANVYSSERGPKVKNTNLRNAGMVGAKTVTDHMEGGEELQQASYLAYEASRPVTGTASRGADLFNSFLH